MTVSIITLGVIAALVIIALLGLAALAYVYAQTAHNNGYDQGLDEGKKAAADYTRDLEKQLVTTTGRLANAHLEYGAQLEDADRRIAIYAGRSWTRDDITLLKRGAKQLKLAAITYSEFEKANLADPARFALDIGSQLEQLAQRIEQQLDGKAPTAILTRVEATPTSDGLLEVALDAFNLTNGKSWLVHGPEGCGKTKNAQAIAAALGLTEIVDDWQPGQPVPATKALVLTNHEGPHQPFTRRILTFAQAMQLVARHAQRGNAA
ncbi:hypothetical protein [Ectopseudomonas mendocina]|uniref:hypothetical protein n=1 Tax=Ectopseudomonas mendocina TaxID=300 RepID=UPI001F289ACF|nr:hypothetical protein [Pseudomonas mendocina]